MSKGEAIKRVAALAEIVRCSGRRTVEVALGDLDELLAAIPKPKPMKLEAVIVLTHLNSATGRAFRQCDSTITLIEQRLREVDGDVNGIKQMISRQVRLWGSDPKMVEYLRPTTLFQRSKFQDYYDQRNEPTIRRNGNAFAPRDGQGEIAAKIIHV